MQQFKKIVKKLQNSRYLNALIKDTGCISNTELLENGVKCSEQILHHWRNTHSLDKEVAANFINTNDNDFMTSSLNRLNFVYSNQFHEKIKYFYSNSDTKQYPAILKTIQTATVDKSSAAHEPHSNLVCSGARQHTFLITDLLVHHAKGFSKFFNSQRECKIWWMRVSSDPSKYFLEPYHFEDIPNTTLPTGTQSVTIKTKLPYFTFDVESITLVPLAGAGLNQTAFQLLSNNKGDQNMPAVIRSVIDLNAATGAILFDSADNDRDNSLLLDRKLAPVQCAVACYHEGKNIDDLEDLCLHLHFVLERSGLRMLSENTVFTDSFQELDVGLQKSDCLGIPYTLIINESTLKTGLLQLRSRDTTLEESIHISDIPAYLLHIFSS
ncbi:DNA polymerase subunit gamma-2, mitochondrial [Rhagoletis pomonella]|uniref:DNA polymerase subunit gamma-2, mitochondrial n=1 Tax=Rhagoletis pomonella TaxID=28610 RepID=UPI0017840E0A|nr:DNA polymerase subunit gamma-2, mitochondrial [Rhagoletis pomonella]